ncbi:cation:proton antiporter [Blastomonas aquatica]|uniref:Na+/H+ antiporter subunit G n=1 Tax=Blastomonas aquatica TaxID=1510276 RepID=A0ABQ1JI89_9SPHN|nr:monovalent cation/H(+) antiporter subunit G [Blastomonas aquatica]GGB69097.1 hypothetical protein GCM10010833_25410 [Blastomonas aquatica]
MLVDGITCALIGAGLLFFWAGTAGIIRFPDTHSRLHALTKADNVGLGLLIVGLALQAPDWLTLGKLAMVWALTLVAAGTTAQLVARAAITKPAARRGPASTAAIPGDTVRSKDRAS